jgi:hypothetical protein
VPAPGVVELLVNSRRAPEPRPPADRVLRSLRARRRERARSRTQRRAPLPRVPELLGHTGGRQGDRDEDIYELATKLDDVVDYIEEVSDLLGLYGIESTTKHAVEQCRILVQATEQLSILLTRLKGLKGVQEPLIELKRLEDDGDRVVHDAIAALFRDDRIDPLIVIRWKDVYEGLERAIDSCETAANVVANIAVKNA